MNNLMRLVDQAQNQTEIIQLLKQYQVFDYVRNELLNDDIDYTGDEFIDEQNVLSLGNIKYYVHQAIQKSIA